MGCWSSRRIVRSRLGQWTRFPDGKGVRPRAHCDSAGLRSGHGIDGILGRLNGTTMELALVNGKYGETGVAGKGDRGSNCINWDWLSGLLD